MKIYKIRGRNLNEALAEARRTCGADAWVLGQEEEVGGGVTLAVARPKAQPLAAAASAGAREVVSTPRPESGAELPAVRRVVPPAVDAAGAQRLVVEPPPAPRGEGPAPTEKPVRKARRASKSRAQVTVAPALPGLSDVEQRLVQSGCSEAFIKRIAVEVEERAAEGIHPIDVAAEAIGSQFQLAKLPRRDDALQALAFVGPTGVGKTVNLIKLGIGMRKAGRRVALATTDQRPGAHERLQAFADLLEIPFRPVDDVNALRKRPWSNRRLDVVLFDVPGISSRDERGMERLRETLHVSGDEIELDAFLVLAANLGEDTLRHAERSYSRLELAGTVITKLDETRQPGTALMSVWRKAWPIGFLSDSGDLKDPLFRPGGALLGDLLLQGKLR